MNRRSFVKGTLLSSAGLAVASPAFAQDQPKPPDVGAYTGRALGPQLSDQAHCGSFRPGTNSGVIFRPSKKNFRSGYQSTGWPLRTVKLE